MGSKTCYYHTNRLGISDLMFRVTIWKVGDDPHKEGEPTSLSRVERSIKWQEKVPVRSMHDYDHECDAKLDQEVSRVQLSSQEEIKIFTLVDSDVCITDQTLYTSSLKTCHWRIKDSDLSRCANHRRERIIRDNGCVTMQVLAAVKYEVDQGKYDEALLCTLRFYRDGLLAMNPGFSNAHRRMIGDEEDDASDLSLEETSNTYCHYDSGLPFYYFRTPNNTSLFRYIIECKNMVREYSELDKMSWRLINAEYDVISERQRNALSMWKQSCSLLEDRTREDHILQIEIETIRDFSCVHDVFIKYKIIASECWTFDNKIQLSKEERDSSSILIDRKQEDDTGVASFIVTEGRTVVSSQPSTYVVDIKKVDVSFCLFLLIWIILSIYIGLQSSGILTLLVLIILDELLGREMNEQNIYSETSTVHIGHCVSMYRRAKANVPDNGALDFEPKLNIKVYRKRTNAVFSLLGETEIPIPIAPGYQEIDLCTTLPTGNIGFSGALFRLEDYYLGTKYIGDDGRDFANASDGYVSTIQSGVVRLRIQNIPNFKHYAVPPSLYYLCPSETWEEPSKDHLLSKLPSFHEEVEATNHQSTVPYMSEQDQGPPRNLKRSERATKILETIKKRRETRIREKSGNQHCKMVTKSKTPHDGCSSTLRSRQSSYKSRTCNALLY